jgi:hypothetical protein
MPYFQVEGKSIYDRLRAPKFHLLSFLDKDDAHRGEQRFQDDFSTLTFRDLDLSSMVDFHVLTLDPNLTERFGVDKSFTMLLRPDNYIAVISVGTSLEPMSNYLMTVFE